MSNKSKLIISVPSQEVRLKWESLDDMPFSAEQIVEIVQRYCDAQDHAKNYRLRAALKVKLLKNRMEQIERLAKASGLSVEEYLEIETGNASEAPGV